MFLTGSATSCPDVHRTQPATARVKHTLQDAAVQGSSTPTPFSVPRPIGSTALPASMEVGVGACQKGKHRVAMGV